MHMHACTTEVASRNSIAACRFISKQFSSLHATGGIDTVNDEVWEERRAVLHRTIKGQILGSFFPMIYTVLLKSYLTDGVPFPVRHQYYCHSSRPSRIEPHGDPPILLYG